MENLQTEVLELEFNEFARGMPTITEEEFAEILLRYTTLCQDDQQVYKERLRARIPDYKVEFIMNTRTSRPFLPYELYFQVNVSYRLYKQVKCYL